MIGGYASALLVIDLGAPAIISVPAAGLITAALGTLLVFPAFGLRLHYVAIATLAIGEIVSRVILNREPDRRRDGTHRHSAPVGRDVVSNRATYWTCLLALISIAALRTRLLNSNLDRTLRAMRLAAASAKLSTTKNQDYTSH